MSRAYVALWMACLVSAGVAHAFPGGDATLPTHGCAAAAARDIPTRSPAGQSAGQTPLASAWPGEEGPCQCYPGGSASTPYWHIVIGAPSCQAAGAACLATLQPSCEQGSRCQVTGYWYECRYVTCNGTPCGYETKCTKTWGCYYCD